MRLLITMLALSLSLGSPLGADAQEQADAGVDAGSDAGLDGGVDTDGGVPRVDLSTPRSAFRGFVFSWKRANLRVGAGYGDFFLEGLGLLIPGSTLRNISPELDVFVRF